MGTTEYKYGLVALYASLREMVVEGRWVNLLVALLFVLVLVGPLAVVDVLVCLGLVE